MGNKQGANTVTPDPQGQKMKDAKNKDERKKEREEKERRKREEKQRKRKKGGKQSPRDDDVDGSSHMTAGDDSESGVFHSAENVSGSPYLDARTVSEMEQLSEAGARVASSTWSSSSGGTYDPHSPHSPYSQDPPPRPQRSQPYLQQHPMILSSSRDFRDGFSLEACLPPEIARSTERSPRWAFTDGADLARTRDYTSPYQITPKAPRPFETTGGSSATYGESSVDGFSTPLAATPVLARANHGEGEASRGHKHSLRADLDSCMNVSATSSSSKSSFNIFTHPFFHKGTHKADFYDSAHSDHPHTPEQHEPFKDQQQSQISLDHPFVPDYRNLPKPSSPHPSRRALSPKMKNTPKKLISSDDSSSSPTTPTPHRRAGNILNIFRPSAFKKDKSKDKEKMSKSAESSQQQAQSMTQSCVDSPEAGDVDAGLSSSSDTKQTKPRWKTWERSSTPKKTPEKTKRLSIFGTSRKAESNKKARESWRSVDVVRPSSSRDHTSSSRSTPSFSNTPLSAESVARAIATSTTTEPSSFSYPSHDNTDTAFVDQLPPHVPACSSHDSQKPPAQVPVSSSTLTRRLKLAMSGVGNKASRTSSRSSDSNLDSKTITPSASGYGSMKRASSSPPTTKSAAFCIMKLEELERAIEKTIREKFPDAEPFILRKPSFSTNGEEEAKGSRSLPTTPSLKKKKYVVRDEADSNNGSGRTSRNNGSSNSSGDGSSNGVFTKTSDKTQRPVDSKFLSPDTKTSNSSMSKSDTAGLPIDRPDNQAVMYESVPSPTMSPVILRRFGAQTRHASISPKVVRAKTAVLYNSPSEMKNIEETSFPAGQGDNQVSATSPEVPSTRKPPHTVTASSSACLGRKVSSPSPLGLTGRQELGATSSLARSKASSSSNSDVNTIDLKPLSSAQKSNSKYDNVMDDEDIPVYAAMKKKSPPLSTSSKPSRNALPSHQYPNGRRLIRQRNTESDEQDSNKEMTEPLAKGKLIVKQTTGGAENIGKAKNSLNNIRDKWTSDKCGNGGGDRAEIKEDTKPLDLRQHGNFTSEVPTFSAVFGSISPKLKRKMKAETKDKRGEAVGSNYDNYPVDLESSIEQDCQQKVQISQQTKQPTKTVNTTSHQRTNIAKTSGTGLDKTRKPLQTSVSLDNTPTASHLRLCEQRGMELQRLNLGPTKLSPTFTSAGTVMVPSQQLSPTNKPKITTTPLLKPPSDSVSAMSVRDRIRSLNKSASEGWVISEPISPTSPTFYHSTVHSPSPSSTCVTSGPYPYPHFSSERGGKNVMSDAQSVNKTRPSTSTTPITRNQATGFCKLQVPQPRPDFIVESATTLGLTSPRSGRKHSTDHVVFGSAVALPCRVYAQTTSPTSPPAPTSPLSPLSPLSPREQWLEKRCEQGAKTTAPLSAMHEGNLSNSREDQNSAKYASRTKEQIITVGNYGAAGREREKVKNEQVLHCRHPSNERKGQCANYKSGDQKNSNTPNVEGPIMTNAPSTHGESCATRPDTGKVVHKGTSLSQLTASGVSDKNETVLTGQISDIAAPTTTTQVGERDSVNTSVSCVPVQTVSSLQSTPGSEQVLSSHSGKLHTSSSVKTSQKYGNLEVGRDNVPTSELSMKGQTSLLSRGSDKDTSVRASGELSYGERYLSQVDNSQKQQQQLQQQQQQQQQHQQHQQSKGEKKTDKNVVQENVESPDVYKPKLKNAEEDTKCSHRQPISKVISDMISGEPQVSHQPSEQQNISLNDQQPQRQRSQRRRRPQPPEHHLQRQQKLQQQFQQHKPVAIVSDTSQEERDREPQMESSFRNEKDNYLEIKIPPRPIVISAISTTRSMTSSDLEKSLTADAIPPPDSKHTQSIIPVPPKVQCESREIQTDIITKADKAIGSGCSPIVGPVQSALTRSQETSYEQFQQQYGEQDIIEDLPHKQEMQTQHVRKEEKVDSETEFLEKIRSSMMPKGQGRVVSVESEHGKSRQTKWRDEEEEMSQDARLGAKDRPRNVPPPSPTAMELLMQEMDEEESEEESHQDRDLQKALKTDSEMQIFSDKVYKRLSDLLCEESEEDISQLGSEYGCSGGLREAEHFADMEQAEQFTGLSHSLKDIQSDVSPERREAPHGRDIVRARGRLDGKMKETSEADSDDMRRPASALERTPRGYESPVLGGSYYKDESDPPVYQHHKTTRVLTIESSSSLTTTTESESEVEEAPPVIVFKPPPSQHSTELRRLRDYREDPELPTLLRKAIISRNLGADLWDDDERSKTKSPIARDSPKSVADPKAQLIPDQRPVGEAKNFQVEEIVVMRQQQQQCQAPGPQIAQSQLQQRRSSREYHSDDDVVAGRGVPDYYDDSTLWTTRRQPGRPPVQFSQLSLAVVAQRRRERRERWLKKRRRNRTDLLSSTGGSSDTDREPPDNVRPTGKEYKAPQTSAQRGPPYTSHHVPNIIIRNRRLVSGSSIDAFNDDFDDMPETHDMGSGILDSPKYSKPIIPSFLRTVTSRGDREAEGGDRSNMNKADDLTQRRENNRSFDTGQSTSNPETPTYVSHDPLATPGPSATGNPLYTGIPGIEETFHELKSVQNILEGLQDRGGQACLNTKPPANPSPRQLRDSNPSLLHPLTKENVRSLRDCDKTGGNRRSRMSLADRTESDLDLYSERGHDDEDGSSGSEYADDEGEDDNDVDDEQTSYATADDDQEDGSSAPGGRPISYLSPSDTSSCNRKSGVLSDEFDTGTDYLVSCTFYNSNVLQSQTPENTTPGVAIPASVRQQQQQQQQQQQHQQLQYDLQYPQHYGLQQPQASFSPFDQLPAVEMAPVEVQSVPAEGARGGTFQSARHQMQDIQSHLQALRLQMAVFPEDKNNDDDCGRGLHSQRKKTTTKRGNE